MTEPIPTQERDILTESEASARAERISNARYELALDLTKGAPTYGGALTLTFDQTREGDLTLNFRGKRIDVLELNGEAVDFQWLGRKLTLPGAALAAANTLRIDYENDYDHGGDGLHQFVDPEDGEEYLYTNFEPFDAHRLFPCFDQPDIKARYRLTVTAPAEWTLTANAREASAETLADGRIRRRYEETPPFSTYLFALIAGPYHVARDEHAGIPLGLLCRKSMAQYLDTDELFTITRQGLDFFGEFFDYAYAFGKYDQIFVPEFNHGAMENVGAVTFNEYSPGIAVGGKPDLLALREDDNLVLDVKTGKPHDWHAHQVLLPMALLPRSDLDEHRERRFRGRLVYDDGLVKELDRRQAEDVYERLPYFLDILTGPEEEAHRVPSRQECGYCPISKTHCPERIELEAPDWDAG